MKADFPPILTGYNDTGALLLNFGWDLDFFGRNRAAVAAATSDARAAMAESAEARLGLTTAIAATYADLARLYAERDVAERARSVCAKRPKDFVFKRVDNGLDTRAEPQPSPGRTTLPLGAEMAAIDEEIATTRNALAALIGAGPDRGLDHPAASGGGAQTLRPTSTAWPPT